MSHEYTKAGAFAHFEDGAEPGGRVVHLVRMLPKEFFLHPVETGMHGSWAKKHVAAGIVGDWFLLVSGMVLTGFCWVVVARMLPPHSLLMLVPSCSIQGLGQSDRTGMD